MIMKYKDLGNMLSNEEMKKVQGGKPPTFWICMSYGSPGLCYISQSQCQVYCYSEGEQCVITSYNCIA